MTVPFRIDLAGRTAVVTGGAGVLGLAFARALAECGAKVAVLDRDATAAETTAAALRADGGTAAAFACDVLDPAALRDTAAAVEAALGPCDLLLNGAGGNHPKGTTTKDILEAADLGDTNLTTFFDLDPAGVSFVFNLNFLGTLLPTQAFARQMIGRPGASIINVSSMNAFRPLTRIPAYSGAKAAVSNFTQWLAVHFAAVGIRVNAIAPGFIVTHQNRALLAGPDGAPTERAEKILAHTPLGRFGEADELIGALLFLASPAASSFVNGVVLPVDGGFAAYAGV
jgi:NAD(P)-dependent dehydrogenase (short-subunit alcohol dehydrogenase family)